MDKELLEKAAKAAGWTWWRSKHGYWNLTAPDGTQHTACHGWTKFNPHTGEAEPEPTPGDALLEVGFCPLYTTPQRKPLTDDLYNELLFAVGNKYPNETRHQTALRYILQAEKGDEKGDEKAAHGIKGGA